MKKLLKYFMAIFTGSALLQSVSAQNRPRFEYDLNFDFRFDNREYEASSYSKSMTILGARLDPTVGLSFSVGLFDHLLMAGASVVKDFGSGPKDFDAEMLLYYRMRTSFGKTAFSLTAGIFPRRFSEGEYSTAFLSDSLKFYDSNLEGLLMSFSRPRSYYEIGCDWMGKYGQTSRERFMLFSSGRSSLTDFFLIGYSASMYHFASSDAVHGVVDNILVNPWLAFELSRYARMQSLSLRLGWLQSMQNDRRNVGSYVFPGGGEFVIGVRNWNVGIENRLYYGSDLMPYYNSTDAGGIKYGDALYFGDPFWRVRQDGSRGFYDRLEVYWAPRIASFMHLKIALVCHFNEGFSGWQQTVGINVDLNRRLTARRDR